MHVLRRVGHGSAAMHEGGIVVENGIERGAAEDASGVPVTPTDVEASRKPPSEPSERSAEATRGDGGDSGEDTD